MKPPGFLFVIGASGAGKTAAVRAARLRGPRAQPELASERMEAWARYLREQAVALGLPVLDTSRLSVDEAAEALRRELADLRRLRETTG